MRRAIALLAIAVLLAGCQTGATTSPPPDGVRISVYQPRPDVAKNRIAIEVHNDGDEPLTVTGATLTSSYFADDLVWGPDRTATVPAGYAVDLRVDIPADADCSGAPVSHLVTFAWQVGDRSGESTVEPEDPFDLLDLLHDAACLVEEVDAVATLTAEALVPPPVLPAPATLIVAVEPTGAEGSVTVDSIHSTTLLNPAGPGATGVPALDLGIVIDATGPPELQIPLVPNRCDAHALAEDKVGTRMPLYITTSAGTSGRLVLAASDELRAQMYAFYSEFCGL